MSTICPYRLTLPLILFAYQFSSFGNTDKGSRARTKRKGREYYTER